MTTCPECGERKNIIYDYPRGEITCASCGCVIDVINIPYIAFQEESKVIRSEFSKRKKIYEKNKNSRKIKDLLNRRKPFLIFSDQVQKYLEHGKNVKLFSHINLKIYNVKIDEKLREIINKIINEDPYLASRTERVKIALAMYFMSLANKREERIKDISNKVGVSEVQVKTILRKLGRIKVADIVNKIRDTILVIR
jgi:transcription initiation factor TFIIIB Brf1 subunit/transcription initiation factor TFIIB